MTKRIPLHSVSEFIDYGLTTSATDTNTGVKFLRITDIQDDAVDWEKVPYCHCSTEEERQYELSEGDILFARTGATTGKSYLIRQCPRGAVFASYLIRVRPKASQIDSSYLSHFLRTRAYWHQVMSSAVGAAQIGVNSTKLGSLLIPLPPLPEQQRIAARLDKADRLRRLRRYALDLGETYLQSVFLEMFGDPVKNEKGWDRATVEELGDVQTGNTPPRDEPENYGDFIEWIKSDDIIDGHLWVSRSREMLSEKGLAKGRSVEPYSLLITCIAGSLTSIGDMALTDRRVTFNQQINAITPHEDVDPYFLYGLFDIARPVVQYHASAGMKHIITKSKLEELVLFKPPPALQEKFAGVVRQYDRLRAQQRESLRQAEMLFGALLEGAFVSE